MIAIIACSMVSFFIGVFAGGWTLYSKLFERLVQEAANDHH